METKTIMYCTFPPKSAMDRLWIWNIYSYVHMYVCIVLCRLHIEVFLGGDRRHVGELWYGILYIQVLSSKGAKKCMNTGRYMFSFSSRFSFFVAVAFA